MFPTSNEKHHLAIRFKYISSSVRIPWNLTCKKVQYLKQTVHFFYLNRQMWVSMCILRLPIPVIFRQSIQDYNNIMIVHHVHIQCCLIIRFIYTKNSVKINILFLWACSKWAMNSLLSNSRCTSTLWVLMCSLRLNEVLKDLLQTWHGRSCTSSVCFDRSACDDAEKVQAWQF